MTKETKKELKKYKDWLNDNHIGMHVKISDYSLNKYIKEQLTLTDVVGRSGQFYCVGHKNNPCKDVNNQCKHCKVIEEFWKQ